VKRPNPTLTELEQWLNELPKIEALKKLNGFEIGKAYYFVRIGGKWRIGKENPYVDAKNIGSKPENILCFADEPDMNKRISGARDSESPKLHTVRIQAVKKDYNSLDKLLVGIRLRKELVEFIWQESPRTIYEKQIDAYKKAYKTNYVIKIFIFIISILGILIYFNQDKINPIHNLNNQIVNELSWRYQKLSSSQKRLFLRKTGLDIASSSETNNANNSLQDLITKHLEKNKSQLDEDLPKNLFLNKLLNEIDNIDTNKKSNLITTAD
jgi:hypothetical protein